MRQGESSLPQRQRPRGAYLHSAYFYILCATFSGKCPLMRHKTCLNHGPACGGVLWLWAYLASARKAPAPQPKMTFEPRQLSPDTTQPPRAVGQAMLSVKKTDAGSGIDRLRTSGALKLLFPRRQNALEALLINTAGGVTGGDQLHLQAAVGAGANLCLTTQAAERAYRAKADIGRVSSQLQVGPGACLHWLPQELIIFEGAAFHRQLHINMAEDARLLLVEPVIFGRAAMGETLQSAQFVDQISINRAGRPLYHDAIRLSGAIQQQLNQPAVAAGGTAIACVVYVAPDAAALVAQVRAGLPATGGASLLGPDMLVIRLVAADGFGLRQFLLPLLDQLSGNTLPVSWRL